MSARVIAQRILTGDIIDYDVPLSMGGVGPRRDLSGPGELRGTVESEYGRLQSADGQGILVPWKTALYYEQNGAIRWGGLLTGRNFVGTQMTLEAAGFTTYPHGIPFEGTIRAAVPKATPDPYAGKDKNHDGYVDYTKPPRSVKIPPPPKPTVTARIDTFEVVRQLWRHVQHYPDGNLGMVVDSHNSGVLLGATDGSEPFELLPWDAVDCGEEIDTLAQQTPFEYIEEHAWVGGSETISHRLRLAHPRLGARRPDLRFVGDENITAIATPQEYGDFANEVYGIGKGEGTKTVTGRYPVRDGRLRRVHVFTDKTAVKSRLDTLSRKELAKRAPGLEIPAITVADHPNARIGSWHLGDDILVQVHVPWIGDLSIWHRITSEQLTDDGTGATLTLARSEKFS